MHKICLFIGTTCLHWWLMIATRHIAITRLGICRWRRPGQHFAFRWCTFNTHIGDSLDDIFHLLSPYLIKAPEPLAPHAYARRAQSDGDASISDAELASWHAEYHARAAPLRRISDTGRRIEEYRHDAGCASGARQEYSRCGDYRGSAIAKPSCSRDNTTTRMISWNKEFNRN